MPYMKQKRRALWPLSALFSGIGALVLYLSFSTQSMTLGAFAVICLWVAAAIIVRSN